MNLYKLLLRPLLFRVDPEIAHHGTIEACRFSGRVPLVPTLTHALFACDLPELRCELAGMQLANPIGLAAGWDKSGRALRMIDHLGFGFTEIGSISARPSVGNPSSVLILASLTLRC